MNKPHLLLWGNLVLVLGIANWTIQDKEDLLENGRVVLLEIEEYDPRSLMQGDYMALRYRIVETIQKHLGEDPERDGIAVLAVDKDSVGSFRRLHEEGETLAGDEQRLRYKLRWGRRDRVRVAAQTFFFQEGMASEFQRARFAELRVDAGGHTLLVALRDQDHQVIGSQDK